jgi:hypothetical protein
MSSLREGPEHQAGVVILPLKGGRGMSLGLKVGSKPSPNPKPCFTTTQD